MSVSDDDDDATSKKDILDTVYILTPQHGLM
jgi:hypothetical protein